MIELLLLIQASGILLFSIGLPFESHCFSLYLSQNVGAYISGTPSGK